MLLGGKYRFHISAKLYNVFAACLFVFRRNCKYLGCTMLKSLIDKVMSFTTIAEYGVKYVYSHVCFRVLCSYEQFICVSPSCVCVLTSSYLCVCFPVFVFL